MYAVIAVAPSGFLLPSITIMLFRENFARRDYRERLVRAEPRGINKIEQPRVRLCPSAADQRCPLLRQLVRHSGPRTDTAESTRLTLSRHLSDYELPENPSLWYIASNCDADRARHAA